MRKQRVGMLLAPSVALLFACGGASSGPDAAEGTDVELEPDAWGQVWRRLALPDAHINELSIASTPSGWFVVSSNDSGGYVYRSVDGTRWQRLTLTDHDAELRLTGVAYADGQYVIVGYGGGAAGPLPLVLLSNDGEHWREPPSGPNGFGLDGVAYAQGRFFGMEFGIVWSSTNGELWVQSELEDAFALESLAAGAGRFLLVGIGPPQLSTDGLRWRAAPIDCALTSACFTDDEASTPINQYRSVFFADGYFYLNQLRSRDGQVWEELEGPRPTGYLSGRFVQLELVELGLEKTLKAWPAGGTPAAVDVRPPPEQPELGARSLPDQLDYSWSDGLDCRSARCVLIGKDLYLIP